MSTARREPSSYRLVAASSVWVWGGGWGTGLTSSGGAVLWQRQRQRQRQNLPRPSVVFLAGSNLGKADGIDDDDDGDYDGDGDGDGDDERGDDDATTFASPAPASIGPLTEDEDAQANKGLPGAIKGGGVLLRVVVFSLAAWCHSAAPLGTLGAAAGGAALGHLVGTPLEWFGVSFVAAAVASGALLTLLERRGGGGAFLQPVRAAGPRSHTTGVKSATPTMGGAAFVPTGVLSALVFTKFSHAVVCALALTTLGFTLIGAYDDAQKLRGKSNDAGLTPRAKLGLQCLVSTAFCAWLAVGSGSPWPGFKPPPTSLNLGGIGLERALAALGLTAAAIPIGRWFWALSAFAMVAESNAVNVTDGLDGLAASTAAVALVSTGISLAASGWFELAAFAVCMGGAAAGFLVVNRHPASCFMGDTGSLALGGALGAVAAAAGGGATLPLVLTSGVFVAETVSVMAQVAYFKWTKKRSATGEGKRLFRMSPLHHHLELGGWGEVRVVATLTAAAGVCAAAGAAVAAGGRIAAAAIAGGV